MQSVRCLRCSLPSGVDRICSIGQTKPVHVYQLIAENTVESKVGYSDASFWEKSHTRIHSRSLIYKKRKRS